MSVTPHGIHTVSLSNDTYLKALVDHSLAWTCKRVFTFFRFPFFNLIFFIIFLNFFLDRIQDLCIIFAIIVVFLVFFNTYIFQAGLVSLLIRKFKTTIIISILYLALSVGLHVWTMVSVPRVWIKLKKTYKFLPKCNLKQAIICICMKYRLAILL